MLLDFLQDVQLHCKVYLIYKKKVWYMFFKKEFIMYLSIDICNEKCIAIKFTTLIEVERKRNVDID